MPDAGCKKCAVVFQIGAKIRGIHVLPQRRKERKGIRMKLIARKLFEIKIKENVIARRLWDEAIFNFVSYRIGPENTKRH